VNYFIFLSCINVIFKLKAIASGFVKSTGIYIVLVDSDSVIAENSIEEFVKVSKSDSRIGPATGQAKIWNANKNFITKCQNV
jgi:hyaluronan synthase